MEESDGVLGDSNSSSACGVGGLLRRICNGKGDGEGRAVHRKE